MSCGYKPRPDLDAVREEMVRKRDLLTVAQSLPSQAQRFVVLLVLHPGQAGKPYQHQVLPRPASESLGGLLRAVERQTELLRSQAQVAPINGLPESVFRPS